MNLKSTFLAFICLAAINVKAQNKEGFIYASMQAEHAIELKNQHPLAIDILASNNDLATVYIDPEVAHLLHQKILSHGPGYLYHSSLNEANALLNRPNLEARNILNYTITEQDYVNQILNSVDGSNIQATILTLEDYGTRYHTNPIANIAADELLLKWQEIINNAGRQNDVSVRLVTHANTPMKSVILTINGNELATEYVIIGGHLDSTVLQENKTFAPGADDNASGIATITEIARVLLNHNFKPQRTVEIMAFAAEEIGLVGSNEIATSYKNENKNVKAFVQFDMTAFKGSQDDVYLTTDRYINTDLNLFLIELMETYNRTGNHQFTYNTTICNYGCSDHYSWATKGYAAAFPFEASFDDSSPFIHTTTDTYQNIGNTPNHAVKFTKLGLEFVVEAAKQTETLGVKDLSSANQFYVDHKSIRFTISSAKKLKSGIVLNVNGQKVASKQMLNNQDNINLFGLPKGAYILLLETELGERLTHKFLLK